MYFDVKIAFGLSLQDLSNITSISKSTLHRYENSVTKIPYDNLEKIADALNQSLDILVSPATETNDITTEESLTDKRMQQMHDLIKLQYNSIIFWCNDQLFYHPEEKYAMLQYISLIFGQLKKLCNNHANAASTWRWRNNDEIEYYKEKEPELSETDIELRFYKNYNERILNELESMIKAFNEFYQTNRDDPENFK